MLTPIIEATTTVVGIEKPGGERKRIARVRPGTGHRRPGGYSISRDTSVTHRTNIVVPVFIVDHTVAIGIFPSAAVDPFRSAKCLGVVTWIARVIGCIWVRIVHRRGGSRQIRGKVIVENRSTSLAHELPQLRGLRVIAPSACGLHLNRKERRTVWRLR